MKTEKERARDRGRKHLWDNREIFLPHLLEHTCVVAEGVARTCELVGWSYVSYLTAAVFDSADLLVEITK